MTLPRPRPPLRRRAPAAVLAVESPADEGRVEGAGGSVEPERDEASSPPKPSGAPGRRRPVLPGPRVGRPGILRHPRLALDDQSGLEQTALRQAAIALHDVTKVYPNGKRALSEVDLIVPDGDFVFLVGPSGAGKTTLTRL
ncbi:MAG: hypothetical protein ACRDGL_00865, partial [Candidatus Limnocylindrales bacterium]